MPALQSSIDAILGHLRDDLRTIRSGRANPAMVEKIPIPAYGSTMALVELATITAPEPRQLLIQPWDRSTIKDIERGVSASGLDLQAVVDGDRLRITLPPLTEERRREYRKFAGEKAEQARVALRRLRDETLRQFRDQERDGALSEDAAARSRDDVERKMKEATDAVAQLLKEKEAELMAV